jgi:type VI protein secretion system component Hcp
MKAKNWILGSVLLLLLTSTGLGQDAIFARYEGMDGESQSENHRRWIEIQAFDWGVISQQRVRGIRSSAKVKDFSIAFYYEKSAVKLVERFLKGYVTPKLEIELVRFVGDTQAPFLRYEFTNVQITDYQVSGDAGSQVPPMVYVANSFEEVKVTYTEYDQMGFSLGNVEMKWKVDGQN